MRMAGNTSSRTCEACSLLQQPFADSTGRERKLFKGQKIGASDGNSRKNDASLFRRQMSVQICRDDVELTVLWRPAGMSCDAGGSVHVDRAANGMCAMSAAAVTPPALRCDDDGHNDSYH